MPRKLKPKPGRDWRVQPLTPRRKETDALGDLRRLASAVRDGGPAVAATIEHWELTDIADYFERVLRETCTLSTPEQNAAMDLIASASTPAEEKAAYDAWAEACDNADAITKRPGGTA